jgi:hypothetical protein
MNEHIETTDTRLCEVCLKEIPHDHVSNGEVDEYVAYYYGLECYAQWREEQTERPK